jgi:hypothetical protein
VLDLTALSKMTTSNALFRIKLLHTVIWVFFVTVIGYVLYCGLANKLTTYRIAIGLVFLEGFVLLVFSGKCPLTLVVRTYSASDRDNFDIFLPNWLARYNKLIFTSVFVFGLLLVAYRWLHQE